jgi:glycosyltransferase involved in cell wall biosynthesis
MADRLDWMFFPAYQLPPLYLGKSIVMLTQDAYYEYKYGSLPLRYRLSYAIFTNWAAKFATKILAISETSKKEVARLYDINLEKIFVAHLGVMIPNAQYAIQDTKYILYVGQAFPRRHLRETIFAFKKIAKEFPDLKFIAVGKDKYSPPIIEELIKKINQELGAKKIIYHDYIEKREDIEKLYSGAKVLIYVSDREAFGLPPMEALAFGIPPVIADNELGHELFGEYAFYVKNTDPDGIAEGIRQALTESDKIARIRASGPEFAKKYNWKSFTDKFLENVKN